MTFRRLVVLVAIVGVAAMASRPAFDSDTWWHLRAGQWIAENGEVPRLDPFSSTARGVRWEYPGWLAQIVMLGFYRLGGLAGLTLFAAIFVGVALLFLWPLLEGPVLLRAAILLLAAASASVHWAARPHIASFALAAFFLWALEQWRRPGRKWAVWLLPPAMAVWVNVHGGFAIGFILLLIYLAGSMTDVAASRLADAGSWATVWRDRRGALGTLGLVFLLCLAATAVNPHGPRILAYPWTTVSIPVLQSHVLEWQSPDFSAPQLYPFLAMLLLLIAVLGVSRVSAGTTDILLVAVWTGLALIAVRNVPVFALVAAPVIARHATAALPTTRGGEVGKGRADRRGLNAVIGAALILLGVAWIAVQAGSQRNEAHLRSQVPVAAVAALRQANPKGNLLNDYNWGGYVLWELYPDFRTFVDGRTDVFTNDVFEDYLRLWAAQPGWEAAIERWDIGTVLLPPESPLVAALEAAGWEAYFRDSQAVVLLRPESP
jgi:hypothetical protein